MTYKKFCFLVLEVVVMLTGIQAVYNNSICSFETSTFGPIRPAFKESFHMKFELIDFTDKISWWEDEYFNEPNLLAKLKVVKKGVETHIIFDYYLEEVATYQVIPSGTPAEKVRTDIRTCKITAMEDSPYKSTYGYPFKNRDGRRRRMYTSNKKFCYSLHHNYAFVQNITLKYRTIPTMQYHGCVYDENEDATLDQTFFWSQKKVILASGDETMPVKKSVFGIQTKYLNDDGVPVLKTTNATENSFWYEGNPIFDPEVFQIPRGMYCENLRTGTKKFPKFPSAFSARLERASVKYDTNGIPKDTGFVSNYEIWYDAEENLARTDHITGVDQLNLFSIFGETSVSSIFDINQGVVYYISKVSGNCFPFEISSDSVLISSGFKRNLASAEEIFGFTDDMQYRGKSNARNILCNAWSSLSKNDDYKTVLTEFYTATEDWHTQSKGKGYDVPVSITKTVFEHTDDLQHKIVTETNIFNFKVAKPQLSVFDITNCMANQDYLFLSFDIKKNFKNLVHEKQKVFLQVIRRAIANYSSIGSILLVQNVELFRNLSTENARINFVLLDQPTLYGQTKKQPGISLNSAFINLGSAINSGSFQILYAIDPTKGEEIIRPSPNSLIKLFQKLDTSVHETVIDSNILQNRFDIQYDPKYDQWNADMQESTEQNTAGIKHTRRYSSGSLIGFGILILIIGIITGVVLMYIYIKKYGGIDGNTVIQMQERSTIFCK